MTPEGDVGGVQPGDEADDGDVTGSTGPLPEPAPRMRPSHLVSMVREIMMVMEIEREGEVTVLC